MRLAPHPQRADPSIGARLAEVLVESATTWTLLDDHGHRCEIDRATLQERAGDPTVGRWVVRPPIPRLGPGDRVTLRWSTRSAPVATPRPDDREGQVVAEDAETVTVVDDQGERHTHWRASGHEVVPPHQRNRLRLVIVR